MRPWKPGVPSGYISTRNKEYAWAAIVSILLLAFGSAPLIAGYAAQTPGLRFIGIFFDRQDYAVHMAMIHYGELGNWDYQLRFTTETASPAYVRLFYVILGHLGKWIRLPAAVLFQIARLLFGWLACLAVYRLFRRIFPSVGQRRLAFILAILGAGLGWLQLLTGLVPSRISPVDLWLIDAYFLFSINLFPHFAAVITAIAIAITAFLDENHQPNWKNILVICICAILVQLVNPIAFLLPDLAMAGIFVFSSWQKHKINFRLGLSLSLVALIQVPLLIYSLLLFTRDPTWAVFNNQNNTPSPPPLYYLFGFGLFWPFALAGMVKALRGRVAELGWAMIWAVCAFGLAYLPVGTQRRFLLAITLPLAVLATQPLMDFSHWLGRRLRIDPYSGAVLISALASISSLLVVANYTLSMMSRPTVLFEPSALVQAVDWLGKNGSPDEVVLASEPTSQLVGMRTPLRLYSGHEMETLHYAEKTQTVESFYLGRQPSGWLEAEGITWVIYGPHETEGQPNPPVVSGAKIAYQNNLVSIYRVSQP